MSALLEPPVAVSDELETAEDAAHEIRCALTFIAAEQLEAGRRYNALAARLLEVEAGAAELRRRRAPGVPFAGGRLYHIEEAGSEA